MGKLITGNALEVLAGMDAESVHCVITSPPYWGLRDYSCPEVIFGGDEACEHEWGDQIITDKRGTQLGKEVTVDARESARGQFCQLCAAWRGQFGLEPTPEMYVEHTLEFLRAIWRVLRKDGTVWWNIGDSYASVHTGGQKSAKSTVGANQPGVQEIRQSKAEPRTYGLKNKDLVLIPFRVALAAQADGWYIRSVIIWHKPNPMPESVRDRPTTSHEYVLLMAKDKKYYYDADAIREPHKWEHVGPKRYAPGECKNKGAIGSPVQGKGNTTGSFRAFAAGGRNKRTVWTISTKPYKGPHYATFPPDLIEPMILAGTSPKVCAECGGPWERVTKASYDESEGLIQRAAHEKYDGIDAGFGTNPGIGRARKAINTLGWRPTCSCGTHTCSLCGYVVQYKQGGISYATQRPRDTKSISSRVGQEALSHRPGISRKGEGQKTQVSQDLRPLRQKVQGQNEGEPLLQSGLCKQVASSERQPQQLSEGSEATEFQGVENHHEWLQGTMDARPSQREQDRLCHGAPAGDGATSAPSTNAKRGRASHQREETGQQARELGVDDHRSTQSLSEPCVPTLRQDIPSQLSCPECNAPLLYVPSDTRPATVADIFCGTGTVAEKCIEHSRDYVMIDIDPKSIEMAEERIAQVQIRLPLMTTDHDQ